MIDSSIIARLVALGRAKGHLTIEDLKAALPVDTMDAEDIALVVVHLEDAGVPVELDERLLGRPSTGRPPTRPVEVVLPATGPSRHPPRTSDQPLSGAEAQSSAEPPKAEQRSGPSAHMAVLGAGILLVLLALGALVLGR